MSSSHTRNDGDKGAPVLRPAHGDKGAPVLRPAHGDKGAPVLRPAHLVIDVTDLDRGSAFWGGLLGLTVGDRQPDCLDLGPLGAGGPILSLQLDPEPKVGKNRLHLEFATNPAAGGVVAAGELARALGGTPASPVFDLETLPWQIWRDPDDNEFCLLTEPVQTTRSPD